MKIKSDTRGLWPRSLYPLNILYYVHVPMSGIEPLCQYFKDFFVNSIPKEAKSYRSSCSIIKLNNNMTYLSTIIVTMYDVIIFTSYNACKKFAGKIIVYGKVCIWTKCHYLIITLIHAAAILLPYILTNDWWPHLGWTAIEFQE